METFQSYWQWTPPGSGLVLGLCAAAVILCAVALVMGDD